MVRTSLITLILFGPADFSTTSNSVFSSAASAAGAGGRAGHHHGATGGGLDAVFVLQDRLQFLRLQKRQTHDLFGEFVQISHFSHPFL